MPQFAEGEERESEHRGLEGAKREGERERERERDHTPSDPGATISHNRNAQLSKAESFVLPVKILAAVTGWDKFLH